MSVDSSLKDSSTICQDLSYVLVKHSLLQNKQDTLKQKDESNELKEKKSF